MIKSPQLFESAPFLENKIGKEWFNSVPKRPGIYRFYDASGNLIYVGKSKNLRYRLFTYKRIRPGGASTKVSRLISKIDLIETEFTNSEEEALLTENRWIRKFRPEFNHVNKSTETYYFIKIKIVGDTVRFNLSMNPAGKIRSADKPLAFRELSTKEIALISAFYQQILKRHRQAREKFLTESSRIISQDQLDDLFIRLQDR
ncbi:MAG: nucleotide excision repair endonuclease [Balneolaceae bacterium]|nr:nucleotide excision repair endonuclease [Balneolaceae bacterium]